MQDLIENHCFCRTPVTVITHDIDFINKMLSEGSTFLPTLRKLDVHKDQKVYTHQPTLHLPEKQGERGRNPSRYHVEETIAEVQELAPPKTSKKRKTITLRKTGKGDLTCKGYVQKVWVWDGTSGQCDQRQMVIRLTESKNGVAEYKYALSNAPGDEYTVEEMVEKLSQRYFVECSFQDAKQEAGMSEYQVRGWLGWHHHMVLVMMALHFIRSEKILYQSEYPLLSAYDIRDIMLRTYS